MPFDRFLIAPFKTGLQTNLKPWQIMDDAFEELQNAYVFRGRIRKRFGSELIGITPDLSQLRVQVGTIGAPSSPVPGAIFAVGQTFTASDQRFTVYQTGTPAAMLHTGVGTGTFNTTTGAFALAGTGLAAGIPIYWYPGQPVMGFTQYLTGAVNNHPTYAFDTQFAYLYTPSSGWSRSGAAIWHGNNTNFFWSTNWQGSATSSASAPVLFTTNFNATLGAGKPAATDDPIWYTPDGTNWTAMLGSSANGIFFMPAGGAVHTGPFVQTARIIVAFKDRLLLLNTIENDNASGGGVGTATAYVNRCRFSFNGSPLAVNAWYEPNQTDASGNVAAGAGFLDAATEEQIISAAFIKDRLIVYFERSTWELAYTQNEVLPFIWQKLNTELGSQSTFSSVPFDKEVLTIGQSGVHACNGSNVIRVDDLIPEEIFTFNNRFNNTVRTFGIRDYETEVVYFAFVSDLEESTQTFPNQILVFNYKNQSWALNDDCFTAFGYFEQTIDETWQTFGILEWQEASVPWNSGVQESNQRQIVAGTPEGFTLLIEPDIARNAASIYITNIVPAASGIVTITAINHNLQSQPTTFPDDSDYVLFENIVGDATIANYLNGTIWPVYQVLTTNTFTINTLNDPNGPLVSGTYTGGGTLARVSNVQIKTKRFNPYDKQDTNVTIQRVDFAVQKTGAWNEGDLVGGGAITVDYYASSSADSMLAGGIQNASIMGTSVLETSAYDPTIYPLENTQELLWHPVYLMSSGTTIQLELYFSPDQMIDRNVTESNFQLEGMILYTAKCSARLQ